MKFFQSSCLLVAAVFLIYVGVVDRRLAPLVLGIASAAAAFNVIGTREP